MHLVGHCASSQELPYTLIKSMRVVVRAPTRVDASAQGADPCHSADKLILTNIRLRKLASLCLTCVVDCPDLHSLWCETPTPADARLVRSLRLAWPQRLEAAAVQRDVAPPLALPAAQVAGARPPRLLRQVLQHRCNGILPHTPAG